MDNKGALEELIGKSSSEFLLELAARVLSRNGYGDIYSCGRRHSWQKSSIGGCELVCHTSLGGFPVTVIIKLIKDYVRTRMLSELAGTVDRTGADSGILVSFKRLGRRMRLVPEQYTKSKVQVIDIDGLIGLLTNFELGVRPDGSPDFAFFGELKRALEDQPKPQDG